MNNLSLNYIDVKVFKNTISVELLWLPKSMKYLGVLLNRKREIMVRVVISQISRHFKLCSKLMLSTWSDPNGQK